MMKRQFKGILLVGLVIGAMSLSGCLFNIFQTARTIGAGNVGMTVGSGLFNLGGPNGGGWILSPQARLAVGVADGVDFGLQSGFLINLQGSEPGWLGAVGDFKVSIFHDPESFSLSMGVGAGYSMEMLGWGALAEVFFDSNVPFFPVFVAYQPNVAFTDDVTVFHHATGGLKLRLSPNARILLQVDYRPGFAEVFPVVSYGLGVEILLGRGGPEPEHGASF